MANVVMKDAPCPFCGGFEFRVTDPEMLRTLYERKGSGSMQLQCKTKGCGIVMYQQQKDLPQGVTDYDERLKLLAKKWRTRAL